MYLVQSCQDIFKTQKELREARNQKFKILLLNPQLFSPVKQTSSVAADLCPRQTKEVFYRQKENRLYIEDKFKMACIMPDYQKEIVYIFCQIIELHRKWRRFPNNWFTQETRNSGFLFRWKNVVYYKFSIIFKKTLALHFLFLTHLSCKDKFQWISVSYHWKYINTCCVRVKLLRIIQSQIIMDWEPNIFLKFEEAFYLDFHICVTFIFPGESKMKDNLDIRTVTEESSLWIMSTWSFTGSLSLCKSFTTKPRNQILFWTERRNS